MKLELVDFLLKTQGYDIDVLQMKAPYGGTVIDPKSPKPHWSQRHIHEMRQRFPYAQYKQYPQYTTSGIGAWAWNNSLMATRSTRVVLPITAAVVAQTVVVKELTETEVAKDKPSWVSWVLGTF